MPCVIFEASWIADRVYGEMKTFSEERLLGNLLKGRGGGGGSRGLVSMDRSEDAYPDRITAVRSGKRKPWKRILMTADLERPQLACDHTRKRTQWRQETV